MVKGFAGKVLHVDLTGGEIRIEEPPESFYRKYLGASGFVGYYLLTEIPKDADPLGPENALIMAGGAITGNPIAGAGRSAVGAKSPLTGGYGEADGGGFFGAELKHAGYDAVVVKGKAEKPVYIWIKEGEVEIRSAEHLWGMTTLDCQNAIQEELDDSRVRCSMIGPGGEKLVRTACVINDLRHAAGRSGLGAVMGSKNLKAIAARGKGRPEVADQESFRGLSRWFVEHWKEKSWGMHDMGTNGGLEGLSAIGALPTRNFQDGSFEGAAEIGGPALRDKITIDREGCYACPIRCKRVVKVEDADYKVDPIYGGPEYETVGAFGSNCGVDDIRAVAKAHEYCNAYSVDTISTGMCVSFAMECFEKGILTLEDTDGLDLSFGNGAAMVEMTRRICEREGLGDLLAEGTKIAAEKIGNGAEFCSVDCKGQPFPMHECRTRHGQGLGYAVSPTGADHMHNFWDQSQAGDPVSEGLQALGVYESVPQTVLNSHKVRAYMVSANWQWVQNSLGHCMFVGWSKDQMIEVVRSITGWQTTLYELLKAGERCVTMARVFNMREGMTRADDVLPPKMQISHVSGTQNEAPIDPEVLYESVTTFYGMMGWDPETGLPTEGKLDELDIAWAKEYL